MMKIKLSGAALALLLSATAAPAFAQTPPPPPPPEAKTNASAYVMAAGAADQFEIQSSQIAQRKSANPAVKRFAGMLVADHQRTTAATLKAAAKAGLPPMTPALDPGAAASIAELNNAAPADFDRLYIGQQIPAHQAALDLHQSYAANGDQPPLKMSAKAAVSPVMRHLEMAETLQKNMHGKMSM